MTRKWKVRLNNQHAMCAYVGEGRTRNEAFYNAIARASVEFLNHKRPDGLGWRELFMGALNGMRSNTSRINFADPRGFSVDIERMN